MRGMEPMGALLSICSMLSITIDNKTLNQRDD
jgi:hypothetical protein